jgi:hypothetical protein
VNRLTKFQFGATHIMLCTMCNGSERFYIEYCSGTVHIVPGIGNFGWISVSVKKSQKSPRNRKAKVPKFRCPVFRGKKFLRVNSLLRGLYPKRARSFGFGEIFNFFYETSKFYQEFFGFWKISDSVWAKKFTKFDFTCLLG